MIYKCDKFKTKCDKFENEMFQSSVYVFLIIGSCIHLEMPELFLGIVGGS